MARCLNTENDTPGSDLPLSCRKIFTNFPSFRLHSVTSLPDRVVQPSASNSVWTLHIIGSPHRRLFPVGLFVNEDVETSGIVSQRRRRQKCGTNVGPLA